MPAYQPIRDLAQLEQYLETVQSKIREVSRPGANIANALSGVTQNIRELSTVATQYLTKNRETLQRAPKSLQPAEQSLNKLLKSIEMNNAKGEWNPVKQEINQLLKTCKSCSEPGVNSTNTKTGMNNRDQKMATGKNEGYASGRDQKAANTGNPRDRDQKSA